jgi:hypothetical protein
VEFADVNQGWAFGQIQQSPYDFVWLRTMDGGSTWTTRNLGTMYPRIENAAFVDSTHGWAVGDNGVILKYNPNPQVTDERNAYLPLSYNLLVYPNPFNAATTFAYTIPRTSRVSLRVFDLLGREVAVLVDEFVEAGTHYATFDGSALASGIYFARLYTGTTLLTKKLMLLK